MSFHSEDQFSDNNFDDEEKEPSEQAKDRYLETDLSELIDKSKLVEARQIPKKAYSLEPDMATGWRPRKKQRINFQNVFPLTFTSWIIDDIVKQSCRKKVARPQLVFLGPRKANSYLLHENRKYQNPYPIDKKVQSLFSERLGIKGIKLKQSQLLFQSDFQSGNLDMAIQIGPNQYDLFMRVDTNTKGHTNWYYFTVSNKEWIGSAKFNICNFRRERSLYQRGMKPYVYSEKQGGEWCQKGYKVSYERKGPRYKFLYDEDPEQNQELLHTYYTMSFSYDFDTINDKVHFAYCIPYTYSHLLDLIRELCPLECVKYETAWRSLSGLPVPMLQITDFDAPNYNKKIVLVTARIHPGESNSSHVCEGLMRYLAYEGGQLLTKYHFYIVPMLNPDGVVAGNYRTSLFGKDLNRTFNQSRKYAFPETFHLVEFAKSLKKQHKQKFNIYLDLHGHSVKKNVFFYGPDYSIMHSYYSQSRDFAKILGNVTTMFRYYSCVFRISMEKLTTARATLNRVVNVPFTYTMQSSNGSYFDSSQHVEVPFTSSKWKEMGASLARALGFWNHNAPSSPVKSNRRKFIDEEEIKKNEQILKNPPGEEKVSDDEISEGNSDAEPEDQDLQDEELEKIQLQISGKLGMKEVKEEDESNRVQSPTKTDRISYKKNQEKEVFDWSRDLRKSQVPAKQDKRQKLPPIPMQLNQAQFLVNRSRKKKSLVIEGLKNLSALEANQIKDKQKKTRIEISQLLMGLRSPGLTIEETKSVLKRKTSRQEIIENARKYK